MTHTFSHASVNGTIIPFEEAQVSLAHPVFLTGFGVYETIQVHGGRPFHLPQHLERLATSARLISMALPGVETLFRWGTGLIRALPPVSYTLQILALGQAPPDAAPLVAFLPRSLVTYPVEYYTAGGAAITFEGQRVIPQCKSLNTLVNHLARTEARRQGAVEAILVHDGRFFEGARSNLFVVEAAGGRLLTPPQSTVLAGITRDVIIRVMESSPYPVQEAPIPLDTPLTEMFLTSTSMHVLPITSLNRQPVGDGAVGPATKEAMVQFGKYYAKQLAALQEAGQP
ncbi:MAG: aminotransferase class IV [Anaerolineae bacterium]